MHWIILQPFKGYTQSTTEIDEFGVELVAFSGGLTFEEYVRQAQNISKQKGLEIPQFIKVTDEELDVLLREYYAGLKTKPSEISQERFDDMLNVLPPSRWTKHGRGGSYFHVCEKITDSLVDWYFSIGNRYYTFVDNFYLPHDQLVKIISEVK